jgi:alpha-beta hydrolase superfamily lysophospholipase
MQVEPGTTGFECLATHPRAALLIVHGLAEYAGRYRELAQILASRGISCFAYDQRGHGTRPGIRTHVERFDDFIDDLNQEAASLQRRSPDLPLFVWGHSMGSIVVIGAVLSARHRWRGAITTSNSLEVFRRGPNPLNPFFRLASSVLPRIRVPLGLDARKISTDEAVQQAYANDPLIPSTASLRLIVELAAACERSRASAAQLTLPWLVAHGEQDAIAPANGSRVLFAAMRSQDKQLEIFSGLRHEVHNERPTERAKFIDLLCSWILARS